tara:strand:+ start:889 stop:1239 length:351 start_codon:yes stop_codon:yes gene_type:complete
VYYKARKLALSNNQPYHLAAILYRNGKPIRIGVNTSKTHPSACRTFPDGKSSAGLHAEMNVLRFARKGDDLEVIRFTKLGKMTMAKPCCFCQRLIKEKQIRRTRYTDWNGEWQVLE